MSTPHNATPSAAVVVGGFPELAQSLNASGRFLEVVAVPSTSALRDSMGSIGELASRSSLAFLFADNMPVDTRQTLEFLISGLIGRGQRVAVLSVNGEAQRLVGQLPSVGLVPAPFTVNRILGALSGMNGMGLLEPVDGGHAELQPGSGIVPPLGSPVADDPFAPPTPVVPGPAEGWADQEAFAPPAQAYPTPPVSPQSFGTPPSPANFASPEPQGQPEVFTPPAAAGFAPPATDQGFTPPAAAGFSPPATDLAAPQGFTPPAEQGFAPPAPQGFAPPADQGFSAPAFAAAEPSGSFAPPPPVNSGGVEDLMTPPEVGGGWSSPATQSDFGAAGGWAPPAQDAQPGWAPPPESWSSGQDQVAPGQGQQGYDTGYQAGGYVDPSYPQQGFAQPDTQGFAQPSQPAGFVSPWGDASEGGYGVDPYAPPVSPLDRGGPAVAQSPRRRGMVIAVTSPKGGTGKSSLSLNLGSYLGLTLRSTGRTVCVVDANFQQADTGKYLGNYEPNIVDLSREGGALDPQTIGRYLFQSREYGITALLGPATPLEGIPQQINGKLYRRIITTLREMFDYIIVDTPVAELYHDIFDNFVLKEADFMVVAVAPNVTTLLNADMYLRTIHADSHAGGRDFPAEKIGILLNRAEEGVDCSEDEVRVELGLWRFLGSVPESRDWKRANNNYELVAHKNYTDLNHSFCKILLEVTQDPALAEVIADPSFGSSSKSKRSLLDRVLGRS
jgi:MinD-like ATPase involved in chromosome partitioning or flagellar assembly